MAKQETKTKVKRSTALKRDDQNIKRRDQNKMYKSRVRTAIRNFVEKLEKGESSTEALNEVYSLVDKCVKTGVYKINKGSRTKSRLAARVAKA
jgi:small subunit ribosomal protein S20